MRNILRNILIFMLFGLTIFQVGTLWFENFSLSNVYYAFSEREVTTVKGMDYVIDRIIVNVGDNKIVGKTSDIYTSEYKNIFDKGIIDAVNNGDKIDLGDFSWTNILKSRAVVYEFSCIYDNKTIPYIFGSSINTDRTGDINGFDYVIIMVASDSSSMTVVFYNSETDKYSAKTIKNSDSISQVYTASTTFANGDATTYISSEQSGFGIFSKNVFIPGWASNSVEYPAIKALGIYANESMAEENAENFFDNPVAKWRSDENNALTYSDENTVVKYDRTTNVFEYSNYRVENVYDSSFSANYISALNTISQDRFIKNEFYLTDYSVDNGKYSFQFNYKINDRWLFPGDEIKKKTGLNSFIEVYTESGKTTKYKKYSFSYEKADENKIADIDFVTAIDKVYDKEQVDNINLCYIDNNQNNIGLNWIIDIVDKRYIEVTERE